MIEMIDMDKLGLPRAKIYSDNTLKSWKKDELIAYIRTLEKNFDAQLRFNATQAHNFNVMLTEMVKLIEE